MWGQNTELQNVTVLAVGQLNGCVMKEGAMCGTIRRQGDTKSWQIELKKKHTQYFGS